MIEYSYFGLEENQIDQFNHLCPLNEWRIYGPSQIENSLRIVPTGLWEKSDSLFLMSSGSSAATAYCMINCSRFDPKANAIDQEPIFFAHVGGEPRLNGIIIHHGNWSGRTATVPDDFYPYLRSSGLGNHYPLAQLPDSISGSNTILESVSQTAAFDTGVQEIIRMANKESRD